MLAVIFILYPRTSVSASRINEVINTNPTVLDGNLKGTKKELVNLVIDNAKNKIDTLLNSKEREYPPYKYEIDMIRNKVFDNDLINRIRGN